MVTTKDRPTPAVHVWDLRTIRKQLTTMDLDYDALALPDQDPADSKAPPFPPLRVDFGGLTGHLEHLNEDPAVLLAPTIASSRTIPATLIFTTAVPTPLSPLVATRRRSTT